MPAKSQAQQKFMGIVHAIQKGDADASDFSKDAQDTAKEMKPSDVKDFASTKHKGLPNKVKSETALKEIIRQTYRESLRESVNEVQYPTDLKIGSVIKGQGFTMLKGIEDGRYYKVVAMDDYSATLVPSDKSGNVKGSKKVRHKLSSIEGGIKTAKRGDNNGIVVIKEGVSESKYKGNLSGDAAEYIAKELSYYVKGIIKQSNNNYTYLHLKDKSYKGKVIKTLKDVYGISATDGGTIFTPSPTIKFSNNEIIEK